jgi:hypothetical protein
LKISHGSSSAKSAHDVHPAASAHPLCFGWKWNSWIFFPEFNALKLAPQSSVTQFIPLLPIRIYFMIQYL